MSLPILIYDERRLTPALGYVFPANWVRPHESLLCMLWKFALQNAIPGHDLASQIARYKIDPYEGVAARKEYVNTQHLARLLGISHRAVPPACCIRSTRRRICAIARAASPTHNIALSIS